MRFFSSTTTTRRPATTQREFKPAGDHLEKREVLSTISPFIHTSAFRVPGSTQGPSGAFSNILLNQGGSVVNVNRGFSTMNSGLFSNLGTSGSFNFNNQLNSFPSGLNSNLFQNPSRFGSLFGIGTSNVPNGFGTASNTLFSNGVNGTFNNSSRVLGGLFNSLNNSFGTTFNSGGTSNGLAFNNGLGSGSFGSFNGFGAQSGLAFNNGLGGTSFGGSPFSGTNFGF